MGSNKNNKRVCYLITKLLRSFCEDEKVVNSDLVYVTKSVPSTCYYISQSVFEILIYSIESVHYDNYCLDKSLYNIEGSLFLVIDRVDGTFNYAKKEKGTRYESKDITLYGNMNHYINSWVFIKKDIVNSLLDI